MSSFLRFVSCLSVLLASLLVAGAPPAAADTVLDAGQALPLSGYAAHVVDEARGRIYITAGPGDDRLAVTDLQGQPVQTVDELTGASSMALSDDGASLFVALETRRVVRLDAEDLSVLQTYELPNFQEVTDLAWSGDRLWMATRPPSCCSNGAIFSLDPAAGEWTPFTGLQGSNPALTSIASGNLVARTDNTLSLIDTVTGQVVTTREFAEYVADLRTSRIGQPYVLTQNNSVGDRLVLLDPDTLQTVRTTQLTTSSAVDTDGTIVVSSIGTEWYEHRGVDVRDAETSSRINRWRLSDVPDEYPLVRATVLTSAGLVVVHRDSETVSATLIRDPSVQSTTIRVDRPPPDTYVGRETTLTGTLTDRGAPIAGAEVRIVDEPGALDHGQPIRTRMATTAEDGTFSFPYTPRTWDDIITFEYAGDELHPAAWQQEHGNFSLQPTHLSLDYPPTPAPGEPITITGTLTALGEPIPGAELETDQACADILPFKVRTDASGRFDLTVTPGRCRADRFEFYYRGTWAYEDKWTEAVVQPTWQTTTTTIVQPAEDAVVGSTFVWTGTFKRAGSPAADVPLTYAIWRGGSVFPGTTVASGTIQTDASGGFRIAETIDGADRYTLVARYEGDDTALGSGASDEFVVTRIPTRVTLDDVDIQVLPDQPITISGRVTTADGTPLADHPIEIWRYGPMVDAMRTDADGRFEYQTVPEPPDNMFDNKRTYRVNVVQDSRYATAQALVSVTIAREPTRLVLENVPSASTAGDAVTLAGRLTTGDGEPLSGREVVVTHTEWGDSTFHVVTDEQGRFSVDTHIKTGYWQYLTASFAGTRLLAPSTGSARWNSTPLPGALTLREVPTRLVGEPIPITGRLTDSEGNAEPGWITISRTKETGQTDRLYEEIPTASDGSFSVTVPAGAVGRYTFTASSRMWRVAAQSDSIVVNVRLLQLTTTALRPDAVRRGWSVFDAARDPLVRTATNPARGGLCVAHDIERLISGTWQPVTTPQCKDTNDAGTLSQRLDVRHPAGSRFRVRAVQDSATRTVGDWVKVRFQ